MTVASDTLRFARALREKAKLSPEQAEGLADAMGEVLQQDVATKSDIRGLEGKLGEMEFRFQVDLRETEARLQAELRELEARLEVKLRELEGRLQADLRQTEMRLATEITATRGQIEASKTDILKWMFGTIGFQTVIILGAVIGSPRT